ncbi:MAG: hypothetical protein QM644_18290 [Mobilitalea sp.]
MPKQSRMDENSIIYQDRIELSEKEKLRSMTLNAKLSYLWEYYKIHAIVIIAVVGLIIYFIYEVITPNVNPVFYAAVLNSPLEDDKKDAFIAEYSEHLKLDPAHEEVVINTQFYFSTAEGSPFTNMQQVLDAYISAGDVDVIIAPESDFNRYAQIGYFDKLSNELPTDVYSSLTDEFYITASEEDTSESAYGVYLTNSSLFKDLTYQGEPYVLGILSNAKHKEDTIEFINYIFNQ